MKKNLTLILSMGLLLTGCQLTLPSDQVKSPESTTAGSTLSPAVTAAPVRTDASDSRTRPASTGEVIVPEKPVTGILSDPAEYSPGNPKSHSPSPVSRNLSQLVDKTTDGFEEYLGVFKDHLGTHYPEYLFRVVSIMNHQEDGKTFKTATAYSEESQDVFMKLYYDGQTVRDTFEEDVLGRKNTMNRWRKAFRKHLDEISVEVAPVYRVSLDVSYDHYEANIPKIILDSPLEPESQSYIRALDMYFEKGYTDSSRIPELADAVYEAMSYQPYRFQEYFIHLEEANGKKTTYQIPLRLINSAEFIPELTKALTKSSGDDLIQPINLD